MSDAALRPESFTMRKFIEEEKEEHIEPTVEEGILAAGKDKIFWKTLKEHFEESVQQLEAINESAIAAGASREQIGENAVVISQVKGVLRKIINVVDDAQLSDGKQK